MKLTKENFLEHFDKGEVFYIAGQQKIDKCFPIKTADLYTNGGAFTVDRKVINFSREHLVLNSMRNVLRDDTFTTYDEACTRMRVNFIELIDHYNRHQFTNNPIKVICILFVMFLSISAGAQSVYTTLSKGPTGYRIHDSIVPLRNPDTINVKYVRIQNKRSVTVVKVARIIMQSVPWGDTRFYYLSGKRIWNLLDYEEVNQ